MLNFVLSWNILFYPSIVNEHFAGYSSLGWHLYSFRVCKTFVQNLLDFRVSDEELSVILIGLPLYFTCPFPLEILIFFLYSVHLVFWLFCDKIIFFLVKSMWFSIGFLYIIGHLIFYVGEIFLCYFVEEDFMSFELGIFAHLYSYHF